MSTAYGPNAGIYYTLDGSDPWFDSMPYTGAFKVPASATIRAIAFNSTYTDSAAAAPVTVQIWVAFPLSAGTAGGGTINISPPPYAGTNLYVSNTVVTLTATPAVGWSFISWTGDSTDTSNVTTLVMNQPRSVQAVFGTSLNLVTIGQGQVTNNPAAGLYPYGSSAQLIAMPAPGSYFFGWAGAASGFSNPLSIQATNASGITALFATNRPGQVSLVVLHGTNGTVAASPFSNVYTNGETLTLTASPNPLHIFTGWTGDVTATNNPLTLVLDSSKVLTANFVPGTETNPPVITQGPLSGTVGPGDTTTLSFQLTGNGPFTYQWDFNGAPIAGATNSTLTLTNFSVSQIGLYWVLVTGLVGNATSPAASLAVFGAGTAQSGGQTFPLLFLNGLPGASYNLEYSTGFANWTLLAPITLSGSEVYYVDDPVSEHPRRFYRAVPQYDTGQPPIPFRASSR